MKTIEEKFKTIEEKFKRREEIFKRIFYYQTGCYCILISVLFLMQMIHPYFFYGGVFGTFIAGIILIYEAFKGKE